MKKAGQCGPTFREGWRALLSLGDEEVVDRPVEHFRTFDLRLEERQDRPDAVAEDLPDLLHVLLLHLYPVLDEFDRVRAGLLLLDQTVDDDAPHGDPEFVEPVDEAGDDGDGEALRERDEKECRQRLVLEELRCLPHPILEGQKIVHERIRLLLLRVGKKFPQGLCLPPALEHLVHPKRVDLRHPQEPPGVGRGRRVEDVEVVFVLEHQIDHVLEHRRFLEGRVHRGRLDEVVGLGRDVGKLEKPVHLLADLVLGPLDGVLGVDLEGKAVRLVADDGRLSEDVLFEERGEAVDGVGRSQEGLFPLLGGPERRRSGHDGLAHSPLAAEEDVLHPRVVLQILGHAGSDRIHGYPPSGC